jgi:hypothetical protein
MDSPDRLLRHLAADVSQRTNEDLAETGHESDDRGQPQGCGNADQDCFLRNDVG